MKKLLLAAAAVVSIAAGAAQSPRFDVASVKPNKSGDATRGRVDLQPGGRFSTTNATLRQLIQSAYQRHAFDRREISGGPAWIDSDRFDIVAKAAGEHRLDADGFPRQTWLMLRALLMERFKLRVREESRELSIYALMMASSDGKTGPRLRRSDVDCALVMAMTIRGERPTIEGKGPLCGFGPYPRRLVANAVSMTSFVGFLSTLVKRPVVDRTGLTGNFDVELEAVEIGPPGPLGPSARPSDTTQSIFAALPEQLGLKLESTRGPIEVLVIESAEQPTPER